MAEEVRMTVADVVAKGLAGEHGDFVVRRSRLSRAS
jgi:hypothetical protein